LKKEKNTNKHNIYGSMYVCRENQKKRAKDKTDEQPFLKIQKGEKEQQYATKRQRENHLTNF